MFELESSIPSSMTITVILIAYPKMKTYVVFYEESSSPNRICCIVRRSLLAVTCSQLEPQSCSFNFLLTLQTNFEYDPWFYKVEILIEENSDHLLSSQCMTRFHLQNDSTSKERFNSILLDSLKADLFWFKLHKPRVSSTKSLRFPYSTTSNDSSPNSKLTYV